MLLARATFHVLTQLQQLLEQIHEDEYAMPLTILSQNSIGKHVRHVVEFYTCLLNGLEKGLVDYDARKRDMKLETDPSYVLEAIDKVNALIVNSLEDRSIQLRICPNLEGEAVNVNTTYFRELGYNIEHVIHHMALIRIAIDMHFHDIQLPENFGVAYSTIKYQQSICAQ